VNLANFEKHKFHAKYSNNKKVNPLRPFSGMRAGVDSDCLCFDSQFECGNLDTVIRTAQDEYELFMRVDTNTKGHTNWYYFNVRNMKKG